MMSMTLNGTLIDIILTSVRYSSCVVAYTCPVYVGIVLHGVIFLMGRKNVSS